MNRTGANQTHVNRMFRGSLEIQRVRFALVCASLLLGSSACLNNDLGTGFSGGGDDGIGAPNPFEGSSGQASPVRLSRVVKSNSDPSGILDLIGDGSGTIGNFCFDASDGGPGSGGAGTGPSTCQCEYSYTTGGGTVTPKYDTEYFESNLIRCRYDQLPSDVREIKVRIVTQAGLSSNQVTFKFSSAGDGLDLTNPNSFLQVKRYQCRDVVTIPYMFDPGQTSGGLVTGMYDPIQSEHILYSYPMNFYTTNLAGAIKAMAEQSMTSPDFFSRWECDFNDASPAPWRNMRIYSEADDGASSLIFPPDGSNHDRSTFFVARKPSGIMNVPLNALIAPYTPTVPVDPAVGAQPGQYPPIGYAARPVSTPGGERCPSTVKIPDGYKWVKLWQFYGDLTRRSYLATTDSVRFGYPAVACNPGRFDGTTWDLEPDGTCDADSISTPSQAGLSRIKNIVPFPDCLVRSDWWRINPGPGANYLGDACETGNSPWLPVCSLRDLGHSCRGLASRVLLSTEADQNVCVLTASTEGFTGYDGVYTLHRPGRATFTQFAYPEESEDLGTEHKGSDVWMRPASRYIVGGSEVAATPVDEDSISWNLSPASTSSNVPSGANPTAPTGATFVNGAYAIPTDGDILGSFQTRFLDAESRFDYLFVVTPETVTRSQMIAGSDAQRAPYTPYTFKNGFQKWGCASDDPLSDPNCMANINRKTSYGILLQEISAPQNAPEQYPLCVIQPCRDGENCQQ